MFPAIIGYAAFLNALDTSELICKRAKKGIANANTLRAKVISWFSKKPESIPEDMISMKVSITLNTKAYFKMKTIIPLTFPLSDLCMGMYLAKALGVPNKATASNNETIAKDNENIPYASGPKPLAISIR